MYAKINYYVVLLIYNMAHECSKSEQSFQARLANFLGEKMVQNAKCVHCIGANEDRMWQSELCRVVLVHGTGYEGWCHVIFRDHVAELSDLTGSECEQLIGVVVAVEKCLRAILLPRKINIASLGTAAPHLHFHVIPRFEDDPSFPAPVWSTPVRSCSRVLPDDFADQFKRELGAALGRSV